MMESIPNLNEARLKIVYPQIADLPYAAQEAVNILRGNLQLSGKGIQAIAVTSAHKEEGKSSVAIQLCSSGYLYQFTGTDILLSGAYRKEWKEV